LKIKFLILFSILFFVYNSSESQEITDTSKFVFIKGGFFRPGNKKSADDGKSGKIIIISSFYISKKEVTNKEYADFLNKVGNKVVAHVPYINLKGKWRDQNCRIYLEDSVYKVEKGFENFPVTYVCYFGAEAFCKYYGFRLPTESEWEYAAKGGKTGNKNKTASLPLDSCAWYKTDSDLKIHAVAQKHASINGLYDIYGNMAEWCSDFYSENSYKNSKRINPKGPEKGDFRVHRGGSWADVPDACNATHRRGSNPAEHNSTIGFRVVKTCN
jgi:formylglycine-generating enzyme required for sulfatase activity